MPDNYADLYNLTDVNAETFSAKFASTSPGSLPPECLLPNQIGFTPLNPLDITIPDLTCKFNVDTPLVPPPYFCTPALTGGFGIHACYETQITVAGAVGIQRVPDSDCDYELIGDIEICSPCIPKIIGGVDINANCEVNGPNPTTVNVIKPLEIVFDEETCTYTLDGEVNVCTECIPDPTFENTVVVDDPEGEYVTSVSLSTDILGTECEPLIKNTLSVGTGKFSTACSLKDVMGGNTFGYNTLSDHASPTLSVSTDCIAYNPEKPDCCETESINIELGVTACSHIEIEPEEGLSIPIDIKLTGTGLSTAPTIGTGNLLLSSIITDGDDPCKKKLKLTGIFENFELASKTLTVCVDGETKTYAFAAVEITPE